jgi:hypothetical protein
MNFLNLVLENAVKEEIAVSRGKSDVLLMSNILKSNLE